MQNLHILIPRHFNFHSSHYTSIWLESISPKLSEYFNIKITWFYYSALKTEKPILKKNENVVLIEDFKNANEVIQKIKPDIVLDSEFPTLIDLSFLAAAKNNSFYVRKYSNHRIFKVPLKFRSTVSRLNTNLPTEQKSSTKRGNFFFYKYCFFIKSLISSNLTFFEKLNFLIISIKWNFITEHPLVNSKIQTDLELLNSNILKNLLLENGYSESKLIVTGNPIFDKVFKKSNNFSKKSTNKLKILFAPYQHYGGDHQDFQEKITKDIVEQITSRKDKFSLVVKLHPSYHDYNYFTKLISSIDDSIPIFQKGSIEDYLDESDILISNGVVSSSSIYGLILKKPVIFCDFYKLYSYDEFNNIILQCNDRNVFLELLQNSYELNQKNSKHIETFLEQNYFKTDGLSSDRVALAIKQLIEHKN